MRGKVEGFVVRTTDWLARILPLGLVMGLGLALGGCYNAPEWAKPRPWGIDRGVAGALDGGSSALYVKGWKDGCETGLSEFGNSAYKTFYRFKQDVSLVDNPEYYTVWKQAEQYCKHYVYKWVNRADTEGTGKLFGINGSPLCVICDPVDKYHGW